jgi:phytoene dehydrogenase-like protein
LACKAADCSPNTHTPNPSHPHPPTHPHTRRKRYKKSPSFFTIHMGVRADALPADTDVHHIIIEDWAKMEEARGTLFISMPTL